MVTSSGSNSRFLRSQAMAAATAALTAPATRTIQVSGLSKAASVESGRRADPNASASRE